MKGPNAKVGVFLIVTLVIAISVVVFIEIGKIESEATYKTMSGTITEVTYDEKEDVVNVEINNTITQFIGNIGNPQEAFHILKLYEGKNVIILYREIVGLNKLIYIKELN